MTTDALKMTVYKQTPGADIEPGWWAVVFPEWKSSPSLNDKWLGPYGSKREATAAGKAVIANR